MIAIAIVSADPILRQDLARALRGEPTIAAVSLADHRADLVPLLKQNRVDVILADASLHEQLADLTGRDAKAVIIMILDGADDAGAGRKALPAGARAILPRLAGRDEIVAAITAVMSGLVIVPHELLPTLLDGASLGEESRDTV